MLLSGDQYSDNEGEEDVYGAAPYLDLREAALQTEQERHRATHP